MAAASQMRDRIGLLRLVPGNDTRFGPTGDWQQYATPWACVLPAKGPAAGTEIVKDDGAQTVVNYEVSIRYRTDVSTADRIAYRNQSLEILSAVDPDGKRHTLEIQARSYPGVQ